MTNVKLGDKCRDSVLGIEGIATVICTYIGRQTRICVEYVNDGKATEIWLDIDRVMVIETAEKGEEE